MKKIISRSKRRITSLIQEARVSEMSLNDLIEIIVRHNKMKRIQREANRYGEFLKWEDGSKWELFYTVPIFTNKGSLSGHRAFFSQKQMPEDKKHLWNKQ